MTDTEKTYVEFTKEMKKDYTILVPNMLPMHFRLIIQVLRDYGYKAELLTSEGPKIAETGLRYVHNDTCYPAILVIGQFLDAIKSGKYDPDKTALILFQTGGGCRASNYISLLRKALIKAGYPNVPVISLSLQGVEHHSGFNPDFGMLKKMFFGILYGDLLMSLVNQCKPFEVNRGEAEKLASLWTERTAAEMGSEGIDFKKCRKNCRKILDDFAKVERVIVPKPKVGVVGEIFVKFSPLGNNNLERFLVSEGAEVVVPGLLDFVIYCVYNMLMDHDLYGRGKKSYPVIKTAYYYLIKHQKEIYDMMAEDGHFRASTPFPHTLSLVQPYIGIGCKMGEGWLLPAEMLELNDSGVKNIVCTQPFGCLPNHICGKGMIKPLKDQNPDLNIVPLDYDAGSTGVNLENRIKLMLANAKY